MDLVATNIDVKKRKRRKNRSKIRMMILLKSKLLQLHQKHLLLKVKI